MVVGLPDKTVAESRERVRAALNALGLALPPKRITVNLAPADLAKEGSHFDLPIALGLLAAMEVLPGEEIEGYVALGEVALDGSLLPVAGVLPAAMGAAAAERGLICPAACGGEAAWAGALEVWAPPAPRARRPRPPRRVRRRAGLRPRPQGHQGPGDGEARARSRRRRRPQPLDDRPSGLGQVHARGAAPRPVAAARSGRGARGQHGAFRRRAAARRQAHAPAPVSRPASLGLAAGAGRRRPARPAGRGVAGASRRALPRRAAGVPRH